jgi:hypothetical protein
MSMHAISVERFIGEVNRRLAGKPGYRDGLEVYLTPRGATASTAVGYDWTFRDDPAASAAVKMATDEVGRQFEVYPPLRSAAQ